MIARLVQHDEDTVREVIHRFDEIGLAGPALYGQEPPPPTQT
ncbi:helix-turn-helix domain-containing protein [Streptomyces ferrugineus]